MRAPIFCLYLAAHVRVYLYIRTFVFVVCLLGSSEMLLESMRLNVCQYKCLPMSVLRLRALATVGIIYPIQLMESIRMPFIRFLIYCHWPASHKRTLTQFQYILVQPPI